MPLSLWKCKQGHITECKTNVHYYYCKGCNSIFYKSECIPVKNHTGTENVSRGRRKGHKQSEETKRKISEKQKLRHQERRESILYAQMEFKKELDAWFLRE